VAKSNSEMNAVSQLQNMDTASVAERRLRMPPIPDDFISLITHEQRIALNQKQQFGWFVKFVRRPLFQPIEVVLSNPDGSEFLVLDTDGVTRAFFNVRTDDLR
jgi:hypothetical protein